MTATAPARHNEARQPPQNQATDSNGARPLPPQNVDAETAVLGLCLTNPTAPDQAATIIGGKDFYQPRHETLWYTIQTLAAAGQPTDPIAVHHELQRRGDTTRAGGAPYLHTLVEQAPIAGDVTYYARLIATTAERRRLAELGTRLVQQAHVIDDLNPSQIRAAAHTWLDERPLRGNAHLERQPVDWPDLWHTPPAPPIPLAEPLLYAGRITWLHAPTGVGKSVLAMQLAAALATGNAALTTHTGLITPVLYIDQENTIDDWRDRLTDMGYAGQPLDALTLHNLADWPPLDTPEGGRALAAEAARTGAGLIIIDTASKVISGEENSNDTYQNLYRNTLVALKRDGRAVLALDHPGKDLDRGARGGSAKTDNVDLAFEMTQRGKTTFSLRRTKTRFRHPTETTYLRRSTDPLTHTVETDDEHTIEMQMQCLQHIRNLELPAATKANDVQTALKDAGYAYRRQTILDAWATYKRELRWPTDW